MNRCTYVRGLDKDYYSLPLCVYQLLLHRFGRKCALHMAVNRGVQRQNMSTMMPMISYSPSTQVLLYLHHASHIPCGQDKEVAASAVDTQE